MTTSCPRSPTAPPTPGRSCCSRPCASASPPPSTPSPRSCSPPPCWRWRSPPSSCAAAGCKPRPSRNRRQAWTPLSGSDNSRAGPAPPHLPDRLVSAVHGGEERGDVAGDQLGLLGGGEVTAAGHHGPAADVIQALGPFPGRLALGNEHVREHRHRGRHPGDVLR